MSQQPGELKRSKYRLLGLIGQGQFGQVFCAVHRQTGRLVALKNLEQDRFPTHKFLRELRFLLSLQHPNIVMFQSLEHTPTGRYLVMDYCEGGTLRSLITEEFRPTLRCSLKIVTDVLAGLEQAHRRGIVHCDIKPENILLHVQAQGWTACISDFGIARLSQEILQQQGPSGSPAYMAPERFYGQYSVSSDLYSVGILLFELITGHRPFSGTPAELMSAHLNLPVQLPATIPTVWQPIILQSLQKLPARRFRSAGDMLAAIWAAAESAAVDLQTSKSEPLFSTAAHLPESSFQSQYQASTDQPITQLAIIPSLLKAPSSVPALKLVHLLHATEQQLWQQTYDAEALLPTENHPSVVVAATSEPIDQLLIRPQGCFLLARRAVGLVSFNTTDTQTNLLVEQSGSQAPMSQSDMSQSFLPIPIATWTEEQITTIDPTGRWLATLPLSPSSNQSVLKFLRLDQRGFQLAAPIRLRRTSESERVIGLLALDARHLAIVTTSSETAEADSTQIKIINRRGTTLGTLSLALRLQQVVLTSTPYQLLATDAEHTGTVLRIDLKPYRVKRLWVDSTPQFLAVTLWGYIFAELAGRLVFLDQEGRLIGSSTSPAPITALAPMAQHGLAIATWNGATGNLSCLDLRLLGLDLVF